MALLPNGLETIELGSTGWREVINNNLHQIYTKTEIENPINDIRFSNNSKGVILKDRATSTNYRLYINNGVLEIETA